MNQDVTEFQFAYVAYASVCDASEDQTDPTLLHYASAITEQKKYWGLLTQKIDRFQTSCAKGAKHVTSYNDTSVYMGLKLLNGSLQNDEAEGNDDATKH